MKKEEEEENVLMSKYQQDQHDDDENFTPLTEELLRNHTWKVNENTNSTPSERAQDSIARIMNKNHQDQEYQNKLLDIAKKYKQTIHKENVEMLQSKIIMQKKYEKQRKPRKHRKIEKMIRLQLFISRTSTLFNPALFVRFLKP